MVCVLSILVFKVSDLIFANFIPTDTEVQERASYRKSFS